MLPPILTDALAPEYVLICRNCVKAKVKATQVLPYLDYMESSCQKAFKMTYSVETSSMAMTTKRVKLSETEDKST